MAIVIIVLAISLIEVYAHSYIPMHELSVVPENQAIAGLNGPEGSYEFVESNCRWIVKWIIEQDSPHIWVWIYKVSENASFLSSNTGILISGLSSFDIFGDSMVRFNEINDLYYENNCAQARAKVFFSKLGIHEVPFDLYLQFYQRTPIGILPTGAHKIPMNGTYHFS